MKTFRSSKIAVVFASAFALTASFSASAGSPMENYVFNGSDFDSCLRSTTDLSVDLPYERLRKFQKALRTFTKYQENGLLAEENEQPYEANDRVCKIMNGKILAQIVAAAEMTEALAARHETTRVIADR